MARVFERANTVPASNRTATAIGKAYYNITQNYENL
jgi:hypothetical protein